MVLAYGLCMGAEETALLRFPAIHGDQIVFTYAGDLYSVPAVGGIARKLTVHSGFEMFPRFSPDGRSIAFTGQYDGNTEVYLVPSEGGIPLRLTYTATLGRDDVSDRMGPNNIVMGWKNTSSEIVFRSRMKSFNPFNGQLFTVTSEGSMPVELPLPRGGFCSYSPDDSRLAYNRIFREFRTWKRYRGGMADDIWIYDFKTKKLENITDHPALDIIPMWKDSRIYFLSDRDLNMRMNLFVYDTESRETRQLTRFDEFDIKFPSLGDKAIVFENGGKIFRFDMETEKAFPVPVIIADDMLNGREILLDVSKNVTNYEIAPDGKRALFGSRGDVFTVPAEKGPTRDITGTPGIHERNSKWSPDGKWISYISDATGEDEIYIVAQDGKGEPLQITKGGDTYKYQPLWSPDSKKLLWSDKRLRLQYVDITARTVTEVAKAEAWEIGEYAWAPDSRWIAYTLPAVQMMNQVMLYSLDTGRTVEATDSWYSSSQPCFSPDGKFLFLVSNRDFNPVYSWTEWNHAYQDMARIYLVTLNASVESPFRPESDEVEIKKEEQKKEKDAKKEKENEKETEVRVRVDADGLKDRIAGLPVAASMYRNMGIAGNMVYYIRKGSKDKESLLFMYDLKEKKETELGPADGFEISSDGKKMLISQKKIYGIIDLPKGPVKIEKPLVLSGLEVKLDRHAEWNQIFNECYRQMREFFYAPNMHGLDWKAVREKYAPLIKHVNHRADLTYVIGEMVSEISAGHTYVGGGDMPQPSRIQTGLLGAEIVKDPSGAFLIKRIFKGANWDNSARSPLTDMGVNVREGEYILEVNGVPSQKLRNFYEPLLNTVGKQITLKVNAKPSADGSREVVVVPIEDESNLYYMNWVHGNIGKVEKATGGNVGYLHIPDMGAAGLNEFVKYFYPQLRKKALIIDVRGNGGGNVSPMIIERLRREIAMIDMSRNTVPGTDPDEMIWGPKVCLMDEFSASDGDLFPYRFKQHKLGKLIGKRSWGGVVGIRGSLPLLDGGQLFKPEFAPYSIDGKEWIIEGRGVEPDILVDNDPAREYEGNDDQLNKAVEVILEELKIHEHTLPPIPQYPDKTPVPDKNK